MWQFSRLEGALRLRLLRWKSKRNPIPLGRVRAVRHQLSGRDVLVPSFRSTVGTAQGLANPFLRDQLKDIQLGLWSLSAEVLNFLEETIHEEKPRLVLEFGSGVSTICLARYLTEVFGSGGPRIFSIEQNRESVKDTQDLLDATGLSGIARIIHSPLTHQSFDGDVLNFYSMSDTHLRNALDQHNPDLILVDGPAAEDGARYGTIPLAQSVVQDTAHFFLDDALRDAELDIADRWAGLPGVELIGLRLLGKGLLEGRLQPCAY